MTDILRTYHVNIDAAPGLEVDPDMARSVTHEAGRLLGGLIGRRLVMVGFTPFGSNDDEPFIDPPTLPADSVAHTLYLTMRGILHKGEPVLGLSRSWRKGARTQSFVSLHDTFRDGGGIESGRTTLHELTHSLGVRDHCSTSSCTMYTCPSEHANRDSSLLRITEPFCGNCTHTLQTLLTEETQRLII